MDVPAHVVDLHDALIHAYDHDDETNEERDAFIDTLKQYTTAVVVASTEAVCDLLGIDMENVQMLELTEAQYHKLEESGMLDVYLEGRDGLDD